MSRCRSPILPVCSAHIFLSQCSKIENWHDSTNVLLNILIIFLSVWKNIFIYRNYCKKRPPQTSKNIAIIHFFGRFRYFTLAKKSSKVSIKWKATVAFNAVKLFLKESYPEEFERHEKYGDWNKCLEKGRYDIPYWPGSKSDKPKPPPEDGYKEYSGRISDYMKYINNIRKNNGQGPIELQVILRTKTKLNFQYFGQEHLAKILNLCEKF